MFFLRFATKAPLLVERRVESFFLRFATIVPQRVERRGCGVEDLFLETDQTAAAEHGHADGLALIGGRGMEGDLRK